MKLLLADGDRERLQKLAALAGREGGLQLVGVARDLVEAMNGVRPPMGARWGTRAWFPRPRPSGGRGRQDPAVDVVLTDAELPEHAGRSLKPIGPGRDPYASPPAVAIKAGGGRDAAWDPPAKQPKVVLFGELDLEARGEEARRVLRDRGRQRSSADLLADLLAIEGGADGFVDARLGLEAVLETARLVHEGEHVFRFFTGGPR